MALQGEGVGGAELGATLEVLAKAASRGGPGSEALAALVEAARRVRAPPPPPGTALLPPRRAVDPAGVREAVAAHLEEWARVCDAPAGDAMYTSFFSGLAASGLLAGEEAQERTFRILTELAVAHCLASESPAAPGALNFAAVDAVARLALLLARHFPEAAGAPTAATRVGMLARALAAAVSTLLADCDERGPAFNPRPHFRLLSLWMGELHAPDAALDARQPAVLAALASTLMALQPLRAPGFAFAWLELVSSRALLPRLLTDHGRKGWPLLQRLLTAILRFLEPYLRNAELSEPVRLLYKGALRVLLVRAARQAAPPQLFAYEREAY